MTQPPVSGGGSVAGSPRIIIPSLATPACEVLSWRVATIDVRSVIALGVTTMLAMTAGLHFRGGYPQCCRSCWRTAPTRISARCGTARLAYSDNSGLTQRPHPCAAGAAVIAASGDDPT